MTKLIHKSLFTGAILLFVLARTPDAQGAIGFINGSFQAGANLFGNPLDAGTGLNNLNNLFATAPDGTSVSLWDASTQQFLQTSLFAGGAWTVNLTLAPGTGAVLTTPSSFVNTFVGTVLNASGGPLAVLGGGIGIDIMPPSSFAGPNGVYLFSSRLPAALPFTSGSADLPPNTDFDAFNLIIGRAPNAGESVTRLNPLTQSYFTTTFDGLAWDNGTPGLGVGEAAFYTLVPEPSSVALGVAATVIFGLSAWRRSKKLGRS